MDAADVSGCPVYLGLDVGTQTVKALLYEDIGENRRIVASSSSNPIPMNDIGNGCMEQHPRDWIVAVHESVRSVFEGRWNLIGRLAAIGVSGQQHGLVAVDMSGDVVRPCMLWCDTRAEKEAEELTRVSGGGTSIPAGFTAPKLLWLRRHEPENFQNTSKVMLPHDYINFYLSGRRVHVMERGDASGTGLLHSSGLFFDKELMDYIDPQLHLKFPKTKLKGANEMIGTLDHGVARSLFQCDQYHYIDAEMRNIHISPGSGDNAMSALGVGCSMPGSGLVVSLGTSGTLFACSAVRLTDCSGTVAPFCDATGNWLPLTCVQNCGLACEEIRLSLCGGDHPLSVVDITALAATEPPGCDGLVLLPYFSSAGERTPNWPHATGGILGLKAGHLRRPGLMYRAAIESVTFSLYRGYSEMKRIGLVMTSTELRVVGGGAKNPLWCQVSCCKKIFIFFPRLYYIIRH